MIQSGLQAALDDVTIWPYLMGELPDTPAAVIRRNAVDAVAVQGSTTPFPNFDVIAIVDMATPERIDDLDGLVEKIIDALRTLKVRVVRVLDEEEFIIGGQPRLGVPITVQILRT